MRTHEQINKSESDTRANSYAYDQFNFESNFKAVQEALYTNCARTIGKYIIISQSWTLPHNIYKNREGSVYVTDVCLKIKATKVQNKNIKSYFCNIGEKQIFMTRTTLITKLKKTIICILLNLAQKMKSLVIEWENYLILYIWKRLHMAYITNA